MISPSSSRKPFLNFLQKGKQAFRYFQYYTSASNGKGHGMHSPFIFDFIVNVLNDDKEYPAYEKMESLRKKLLQDKTILNIDDMGAGSQVSATNQRTIASIAKNAAKSPRFGQLLFRMVNYYKPASVIELGTSLGITTAYLGSGNPAAKIFSIEGSEEIKNVADRNLKNLGIENINLLQGNFDDVLPRLLEKTGKVDFVFIDGNHRKTPTENYFNLLLPKVHNDTILIFDDIHWTGEMESAWKTISSHPDVTAAIDLFFIGIIFFRKEFREKQQVAIRF